MKNEDTNIMIRMLIGLVVLLLVAGFVFVVYRTGKAGASTQVDNVNKLNTTMSESRYTDYEGETITGSEVLSILKNYANDEVRLDVDGTSFNYTDNTLTTKATTEAAKASRRDSGYYISPSARYDVTIERADDGTNEVRAMVFTIVP